MTFTIDVDNNISVLASSEKIPEQEGNKTFSSPRELAALAAKWPGARLVEIWNSLPGVEPVERFTSRQVAATRIWKAIQNLQPSASARRRGAETADAGDKGSRPRGPGNTQTGEWDGPLP